MVYLFWSFYGLIRYMDMQCDMLGLGTTITFYSSTYDLHIQVPNMTSLFFSELSRTSELQGQSSSMN